MARMVRGSLQVLAYAAFATALGFFSERPAYTYLQPDRAVIKLSVDQYGRHVGKCRRRTPAELAALPEYDRVPVVCPRRRYPVRVALRLDGRLLYDRTRAPAGLHHDGLSYIYARFVVPAGRHRLQVSLWDDGPRAAPARARAMEITLRPAQVFVIEFSSRHGVFVFR